MVFAVVVYLALLLGSLVAVGGGITKVLEGFERWEEANALLDVPVASLDAVAVGEAAVSGTVRPSGRPTTVPVGDERCVVYDLTVEDSTDAMPVYENRRSVEFYATDGEGRVRVDPADMSLDLSGDRTESFEFKSYDEVPDRAEPFHGNHDLPDRGMRRDRTFEYEYVAPGDEVYAYGRIAVDDRREATGDEKSVVLEAGDSGFISDKPREQLLSERRFALVKSVSLGVTVGTVGLGAFLLLSGIAQLFLGF